MNKNDILKKYVHEQVMKRLVEMTGRTPAHDGGMLDPGKVGETPEDRLGQLDPAKVEEATGATPAHDGGTMDPGKVKEDPKDRMGNLDPAKLTELRSAIRKIASGIVREMTNATPAHDGGMVDPGNVSGDGEDRLGQTDPGKLVETSGNAFPPDEMKELLLIIKQYAEPMKLVKHSDTSLTVAWHNHVAEMSVEIQSTGKAGEYKVITSYKWDKKKTDFAAPVKIYSTNVEANKTLKKVDGSTLKDILHGFSKVAIVSIKRARNKINLLSWDKMLAKEGVQRGSDTQRLK